VSQPWWANVLGRGKTPAIANAFRSHGGLTPAALVNVRLCIAKIVILPVDGRCMSAKSGGVSPPWRL